MITKEQLAASLTRECDISIHLFGKLPPDSADYRPSPGQRSTVELLRYLAICGIATARSMAERDWGIFKTYTEGVAEMPLESFPAAMARQKAELEAFFEKYSADELTTRSAKLPGGAEMNLGAAVMNGPLKWLTAYKLQLFLYAKALGATEISTTNAWAGIDWKK